jgi:hypothetical protein
MRRLIGAVVGAGLLFAAGASAQQSAPSETGLAQALTSGKPTIYLRPRYEHVEQDGKPENADALTMRTLLGYRTGTWQGLSAYFEGINVGHLGDQNYNDKTTVTNSPFPTVADPDGTDINQFYADYTGVPDTLVRAGRQLIKLDNVRFIGNVDFRQFMQVFNAVSVENTSLANTRLYAGYLMRQRTTADTQRDINAPLFNARYTWKPGNVLVAYAYLQDQANTGQATGFADNSNKIFGVRADGGYPVNDLWKVLYTAEYAKQDPYSGGDARIDASYYHVALGVQRGDVFLRVEEERLSSNKGLYGFQTPLGTNHLFQGWADLFLTTPAQGIRDAYLTAGGKLGKVALYGEYHRFRSDVGNIDFGHEIDVGITYPIRPYLIGKFEYANYSSADAIAAKPDTRKIWLTLIYTY